MKVILTEEVVNLGEPGDIVDVAPGYARNYLIPRKLAEYANTGKAKELEHHRRRLERKRDRLAQAAKSEAQRIDGETLVIAGRVGEGGKLYGSITAGQIAEALHALYSVDVDRRKIHIPEPIRTIGSHSVEVRFIGDTRATLTVNIYDAAKAEQASHAPTLQDEDQPVPEKGADAEETVEAEEEVGLKEEESEA